MASLWGNPLSLYAYGGEVGEWLSEFVGVPGLDLVNFGEKLIERNRPEFDYNRFMLLSEASLAELNSRLTNQVTTRNCRPNLVAKGVSKPFDEDEWTSLTIGKCHLKRVAFCIRSVPRKEEIFGKVFDNYIDFRCNMTTVDPDTGVKSQNMEPLRTLKEYRMRAEVDKTGPLFGAYLDLAGDEGGQIKVGDSIVEEII